MFRHHASFTGPPRSVRLSYASKKSGERTRTRTSIAGLEDRSLSRWQMRPELELRAGIEPACSVLQTGRSTTLGTATCLARENLQPSGSEPDASPLVLLPKKFGQGGWSRSSGLRAPNAALCPLSYTLSCRLARTGGLEPPFATPITVHRFVAGVGYVRIMAATEIRAPIFRVENPAS